MDRPRLYGLSPDFLFNTGWCGKSHYVLLPDGSIGQGCSVNIGQGGYSMTATITLDVHGAPDAIIANPSAAAGSNWVTSSFQINWTGPTRGAFDSHLPGATSVMSSAEVYNDIANYGQELAVASYSSLANGLNHVETAASLIRCTDGTSGSWLSDLSFIETAGLAPGSGAINWLNFSTLSYTEGLDTAGNTIIAAVLPGSRAGNFLVTSMTIISDVPEPDTLALLGVGVAALGWTQRRRKVQ